ncbi:metalloregulator ArsR/SmtB family transcription factor [Candidatus Berkiella cookevillensis]|uniref:Biofilm growth-associated repressor n=1 Tax=Candidatus Berkiella cookevillensis TaxID=437022 RepID=A0A0Q9YUD9_9GAMM|nr:metalloregulator ArsR/SmtB family transcription factor [Candidatus Berkiella cookevillensis]MCS5707653.1 metalloregulator ArsR/SmtB family transcription factor [Candidatus Berkiella cookevillensis]
MNKQREKLERAVGLLKLLSHPVRLSILCNLIHNGEMSVTEIVAAEEGTAGQSQISQFLAKMRSEGLVKTRKHAQTVYYGIDSSQAKRLVQALYEIYCGEDY